MIVVGSGKTNNESCLYVSVSVCVPTLEHIGKQQNSRRNSHSLAIKINSPACIGKMQKCPWREREPISARGLPHFPPRACVCCGNKRDAAIYRQILASFNCTGGELCVYTWHANEAAACSPISDSMHSPPAFSNDFSSRISLSLTHKSRSRQQ
jgi:hypothetical protein